MYNDNDNGNAMALSASFRASSLTEGNNAMNDVVRQSLVEELDCFDPRWRENYKSLHAACDAAGDHAQDLYRAFLETAEGQALVKTKQTEIDWTEVNERSKAQVAAEIDMANRIGSR